MFCTNCGAPMDDDARFCTSCGQPADAPAQIDPTAQAAPVATAQPAAAPASRPRKGLVAGIVAAVVVVIALIGGAVALLGGGDEPDEAYLEIVALDSGGFPDEILVFISVTDEDGADIVSLEKANFVITESAGEGDAGAVTIVDLSLVDKGEVPYGDSLEAGAVFYMLACKPASGEIDADHDIFIELDPESGWIGATGKRYTPSPGAGEGNDPDEADALSSDTPAFYGVTAARASSVRASEYGNTYEASNVLSYSGSAWCEGVSGSGVGEWLEFEGSGRQTFSGFSINAGYESSHGSSTWDHYSYNNRPKNITVYADGSKVGSFTLDDAAVLARDTGDAVQTVTFAAPVVATTMRVVVDSVYVGSCPDDDTCISLVIFF